MGRWYRLVTQILGCLGLILLSITLFTPNWMMIMCPYFNFTMGLWSICVNKTCTKLVVYSVTFEIYRALMITTVIIGMMAVATSFVPILRRYQLPVITNVSTGLLSLIFMLTYGQWISMRLLLDGLGFPLLAYFSWSFLLGCLGCAMFMLCGFLNVLIEVETAPRIHPKSILVRKSQDTSAWRNKEHPQGKRSFVQQVDS